MNKYKVQFLTHGGAIQTAKAIDSNYRDAADWVARNYDNVKQVLGVTFIRPNKPKGKK